MSAFFSTGFLDQVRHSNDIIEIIGAVLPLKRSGSNWVTLCPFHREKTPSFNVIPQKQIFYCFGCHKGGDVFRFIQDYEGLDFVDAVIRLAERAHIPIEQSASPSRSEDAGVKDLLLAIHEHLASHWHHLLLNDAAAQVARDYLNKRKLSNEAVQSFRIGFAPPAWDDTLNWGKSKGYNAQILARAGLILQRNEGSNYYDRFRNRLMFPINDEQGRVIGFSGRVLDAESKTAKYINSPETLLFHKSRVIFALDKAKREILDRKSVVICEGQIDTIACHMVGITNVVAPQGTALTTDQTRILKRFAEEVVLCFDADSAGQDATIKALDDLIASGLAVRVAKVPLPHDPDSYIQAYGAESFRTLIEKAPAFFDFYLEHLCRVHPIDTEKGKVDVVKHMGVAAEKTGNAVIIDTCAQKVSQRLGVSLDAVRTEFKRGRIKSNNPRFRRQVERDTPLPKAKEKPHPQEFWMLKLVLCDEELAGFVSHHLDPEWITSAPVKHIIQARLEMEREGKWAGLPKLLDQLEDATLQSLVAEAASDPREIPDPEKQLYDCMIFLRNRAADLQIDRINRQLSHLSEEATLQAFLDLKHWRDLKKHPLQPRK